MILNALARYYDVLIERRESGVPASGYSSAKVAYAFCLSDKGELVSAIALGDDRRPGTGVDLVVPQQAKRSSGISPNFMCDNSTYMVGRDKKDKTERTLRAFEASRDLHREILGGVDDDGARAVVAYFDNWDPSQAQAHPALKPVWDAVLSGGNIVFRLESSPGYIHERVAVKQAWREYRKLRTSETVAQCLVTGDFGPIARLHPNIKGVRGAQTSGASLVSFNLPAFTSFGKEQGDNAPVGDRAAFAYGTALNHMLSSRRQRLQLDDNTTVVFWAESPSGIEEDLMAEALYPTRDPREESESFSQVDPIRLVRDVLQRVRNGQPLDLPVIQASLDTSFYILGLSPNSSRLSVRFWHSGTFGDILTRVAQHYLDTEIVRSSENDPEFIPVSWVLNETAPRKARDRVPPPLLAGGLMRSILTGRSYPRILFTAILSRIRADQMVNYVRAAAIKAYLLRTRRIRGYQEEVGVSVSLNEQNASVSYRLGRLFAVLEKAQQDANPGINSTIRDRFFGAASATPGAVFPRLLRLSQHHISKSDYGSLSDRRIQEIMNGIDGFPSHLNMQEQGEFMLGYYHQKQALYQKSQGREG